jgi:hypothetical protein
MPRMLLKSIRVVLPRDAAHPALSLPFGIRKNLEFRFQLIGRFPSRALHELPCRGFCFSAIAFALSRSMAGLDGSGRKFFLLTAAVNDRLRVVRLNVVRLRVVQLRRR